MPFAATFRSPDGTILERLFPSRESVPTWLTNRNDPEKKLRPGERAEFLPFMAKSCGRRPKYPIISDSIGVLSPEQIPEARDRLGCDFTPGGRAIIRSRAHRLSVLKRYGGRELS